MVRPHFKIASPETSSISITILVLPRQKRNVIIMGASERTMPEGGSLVLNCVLNNDGSPDTSIVWVLPNDELRKSDIKSAGEPGILRIEPFKVRTVVYALRLFYMLYIFSIYFK